MAHWRTTKQRQNIGQRRFASRDDTTTDQEAWDSADPPSPSAAIGMCAWCGADLIDQEGTHCPADTGCRFEGWAGR